MPDYSADDHGTALARLTGFGNVIGAFHQGSFRTEIGVTVDGRYINAVGGRPLGNGYCAGVCLDWIRRVLMSGPDRDQRYLSYYSADIGSGADVGGRTNEAARERAFQSASRMAQAYVRRNNVQWTQPGDAPANAPYTMNAAQFSAAATAVDEYFDEKRDEAGRDRSQKRFSNLVVTSSDRRTYDSPGRWMGALLGALAAGACTQVNFSRSGQSGHAVTIWRRRAGDAPDAHYFFDPNYGVFSYNRSGLQDALQYLFWEDAEDTPHYDTCASEDAQVMSYAVYGPPRLA